MRTNRQIGSEDQRFLAESRISEEGSVVGGRCRCGRAGRATSPQDGGQKSQPPASGSSSRAACSVQCGSKRASRASSTRSACPRARIRSAWRGGEDEADRHGRDAGLAAERLRVGNLVAGPGRPAGRFEIRERGGPRGSRATSSRWRPPRAREARGRGPWCPPSPSRRPPHRHTRGGTRGAGPQATPRAPPPRSRGRSASARAGRLRSRPAAGCRSGSRTSG